MRSNRPLQLAVRVADADGKPIVGLKLRIHTLLWSGRPGPLVEVPELADNRLSVTTDQDGRGVFAGLPAGAQVMLAHPDERYAQFGFGSWLFLGDGLQADAGTLTLGAAATISGTVRYAGPEARPAVGVNVHAQPRGFGARAGNADTRADDQGHFTFRQMAAASYDLRCYLDGETQRQWASPPRESTVEYSFHTEGKGYTREGIGQVTLTPGEKRQLAGWQLASAHLSIAGKVVDASGKPVAGATVYPEAQRVQNRGTTSDANGGFRLAGLGEEWMWLSVNFGTPTATMVRVKAGDEQVRVELPEPRAGGKRDEDHRSEHFAAMIGKPAPAVRAATWINAPTLPAEPWRGKVVMVDFWAVTCGPCIGALPEEEKFWEANQAHDLVMVGLHNAGPALEVQEFLTKQGLKITFALAMDGQHGATASAYGVEALPAYAVVDREGRIAYLGHQWEQARQRATDLLDKHP